VFVGLQLEQDRRIAESSLLFDATNTQMYWVELVRESPDVWLKGLGGQPLTAVEAAEFERIAVAWELWHYTAYVVQPLLGIDAGKFVREWALQLFSHPGLMAWWKRYRSKSLYTQPEAFGPGEANPWFDSIDEELRRLQQDPSQID